ncbi:tRNA (adenosine(37)-N6)-threonylcarbamoyltransferase complex transferase subunit TsaD [Candidatus Peregrinibacteria bacterium]|nr:tRNA (adenosine(37)-N6)-threonylcarbamoyltransferase complex transferase subunit TsaD [Candidatus Peregrinibacteria bacterium]
MLILGIETSCDETAVAVVENGRRVLSNVIFSQIPLHQKTGGVVPEVAAREHTSSIIPVIKRALTEAGVAPKELSAIAATAGPGLIGCLLTGLTTAKTLALIWRKPFIPVDHIKGHLMSPWLLNPSGTSEKFASMTPRFPIVSLTASGGHNELVLLRAPRRRNGMPRLTILGQTLDDAAGEAYDKAARIMGLGYPGGPAISQAAVGGNPHRYPLPRAWLEKGKNPRKWQNFSFSFSGLKSALLRLVESLPRNRPSSDVDGVRLQADLAASFQEAVNDVLATKLLLAAERYSAREIHLAGGVSANTDLREKIRRAVETRQHPLFGRLTFHKNITFRTPQTLSFCTDNAAMIASAGYFRYQQNPRRYSRWRNFEAYSDR